MKGAAKRVKGTFWISLPRICGIVVLGVKVDEGSVENTLCSHRRAPGEQGGGEPVLTNENTGEAFGPEDLFEASESYGTLVARSAS